MYICMYVCFYVYMYVCMCLCSMSECTYTQQAIHQFLVQLEREAMNTSGFNAVKKDNYKTRDWLTSQ